jgi:pimeloyl-ACP methyl ester carboxylesterase
MIEALPRAALPEGVRARHVERVNGLRMHLLEAGEEGRPLVLLLHGFPELGYSWRRILPALGAAGYHAVAPDQRGYGRTEGWTASFGDDLAPFRLFNYVTDALALVRALGRREAAGVFGHDFGSPVAAACALARPDVFRRLALLSGPFGGTPEPPFGEPESDAVHHALAALPRPRKHYQWYYSTAPADADMRNAPQGLHAFLRAYYHMKSADWPGNTPHPLAGWTAEALAELPTYYVMDLGATMPQSVEMPAPAQVAACGWLTERELAVYAAEYARTGFQGGLQFYRGRTGGLHRAEFALYSGRAIEVPTIYVAGRSDWGVYQAPGAFERMQRGACRDFRGAHLLDGAGHWVQQEQPEAVARLLLEFLGA